MSTEYAMYYQQLGRLLESPPDLSSQQACVQPTALQWFGRAFALVKEANVASGFDAIRFSTAMDNMRTAAWQSSVTQVFQIMYRALGHCEMQLPAGSAGSFVPVGSSFDAFAALSKIFVTATQDVFIVDPYMDHAALVDFGPAVPEGVQLRLLAGSAEHKATLLPASQKWTAQYGGNRPLDVRLAPAKSLHDRAIFIDKREAWTLTQSLKDFAKRAPAEIVRADSIAALKIDAYEEIWANAAKLV